MLALLFFSTQGSVEAVSLAALRHTAVRRICGDAEPPAAGETRRAAAGVTAASAAGAAAGASPEGT